MLSIREIGARQAYCIGGPSILFFIFFSIFFYCGSLEGPVIMLCAFIGAVLYFL